MGYEVQVGWGKAVPLPPAPFYVGSNTVDENVSRPSGFSG